MRHGPAGAGLILLLGSLLQGCDPGSPVVPHEGGLYRSVEIALGAQQGCVSVIAEAVLTVTPEGRASRELRQNVPAGATTVRFDDIEVQQGTVQFDVQILSNNATVLYSKVVSQQIDAATFDVPIVPEKRAPVLEVCPGDIVLDRQSQFFTTLQVSNRGIGTLRYQGVSPECDGGPCLGFEVPEGSVAAGMTDPFFVFLRRMAPQASLELLIQSEEGSVPVTVTLPQLPELVPVSVDSTGSHPGTFDNVVVPVHVVIRNDGNVAAEVFKVAAHYTDNQGFDAVKPFLIPGEDQFYPFTVAPLEPGAEVTFDGVVSLGGVPGGQTVQVRIEVDSCSEDQLLAPPCRVDEFDEFNNFSAAIPAFIPSPPGTANP